MAIRSGLELPAAESSGQSCCYCRSFQIRYSNLGKLPVVVSVGYLLSGCSTLCRDSLFT